MTATLVRPVSQPVIDADVPQYTELDRETTMVQSRRDAQMDTSAATLASFLHRSQTRVVRGDMPRVPYIEHPLRVALRLVRWGVADPSLIAAALLHDVAEDCEDELVERFGREGQSATEWISENHGPAVGVTVAAVTNPTDGTDYLDHLREITSTDALLVKASDLVDNAGSLAHQYGQVKDSFVTKRLPKYRAAVQIVRDALGKKVDVRAVHAAKRLTVLAEELNALALRIEQNQV